MEKRRIFWTVLLTLLVLSACLAMIFLTSLRQVIQEGLVLPIAYSLWLISLLIRSMDQEVLWVIALLILGGLFSYLLSRGWSIRLPGRLLLPPQADEPGSVHWRVRFWRTKLATLEDQGVDSKYASYEFRMLARQVVALSQGFPDSGGRLPEHVPEAVIRQAPATIQPLLSREGLEPGAVLGLRGLLRSLFRLGGPGPGQTAQTAHTALVDLCTYLEERLEIQDEL